MQISHSEFSHNHLFYISPHVPDDWSDMSVTTRSSSACAHATTAEYADCYDENVRKLAQLLSAVSGNDITYIHEYNNHIIHIIVRLSMIV